MRQKGMGLMATALAASATVGCSGGDSHPADPFIVNQDRLIAHSIREWGEVDPVNIRAVVEPDDVTIVKPANGGPGVAHVLGYYYFWRMDDPHHVPYQMVVEYDPETRQRRPRCFATLAEIRGGSREPCFPVDR